MNLENLVKFRNLLIKNKIAVSEIEYTKGNYDDHGKLIKEALPTITTGFCEIGLFKEKVYFVFIVNSQTFNRSLFYKLKKEPNISFYGLKNFKRTLYPIGNFNLDNFMKEIKKDKYLQIQIDFNNMSSFDLFKKYLKLVNIFKDNKISIINQLKSSLE